MLVYLDNAESRRQAPNENFARELLELFTLGEGRYAEADLKAAARAFTGWSVDADSGAFRFRAAWHDDGGKHLFGQSGAFGRSEEHTSELQSLMRTSYAVFCFKKKKTKNTIQNPNPSKQTITNHQPP